MAHARVKSFLLNKNEATQRCNKSNKCACLSFYRNYNGGNKLLDKRKNLRESSHFLGLRKVLNLSVKAEKQLQNENHTEDWALGSHPRDNGHVTR